MWSHIKKKKKERKTNNTNAWSYSEHWSLKILTWILSPFLYVDSCLPFWTVGTDNHWSICFWDFWKPSSGCYSLSWSGLRAVPFSGGKKKKIHKPQTMLSEQCFDLAGAHVKSNSYFVIVLKLLPFNGFKFAFFFLLLEVWLNTSQTLSIS